MFKRPDLSLPQFFKDFSKSEASLHMICVNEENEEDVMSPISSSEEGEITNAKILKDEEGYQLFEMAGQFVTKNLDVSWHSGVFVKTAFNFRINQFPNN